MASDTATTMRSQQTIGAFCAWVLGVSMWLAYVYVWVNVRQYGDAWLAIFWGPIGLIPLLSAIYLCGGRKYASWKTVALLSIYLLCLSVTSVCVFALHVANV